MSQSMRLRGGYPHEQKQARVFQKHPDVSWQARACLLRSMGMDGYHPRDQPLRLKETMARPAKTITAAMTFPTVRTSMPR